MFNEKEEMFMDNCESFNGDETKKTLHAERDESYEAPEIVTFKEGDIMDALGPALANTSGSVAGGGNGGVLGLP